MEKFDRFICGDALAALRKLKADSIDMCLTSPPYWGLRDYGFEQIFNGDEDCEHEWVEEKMTLQHENRNLITGTQEQAHKKRGTTFIKKYDDKKAGFCLKCGAWKGQLGLEPTPEMYIEHLTEMFNEVKRVLKKEGTLWLNIGDTYNSQGTNMKRHWDHRGKNLEKGKMMLISKNLPPKCLCMIPERLAWSLIQNGWILRNKIIWFKPNSMPSSVKDRFNNKWEYLFLFSKSQRYYFDLDAIREPHKYDGRIDTLYKGGPKDMQIGKHERWPNPDGKNPGDIIHTPAETRTLGAILGLKGTIKVPGGKGWVGHPPGGEHRIKHDPRWCPPEGKNPGDFWDINTQPFPEAHFAVFPEKLCEKPIKAGCPEEVCKKCGKARERIIEKGEKILSATDGRKGKPHGDTIANIKKGYGDMKGIYGRSFPKHETKTIGWTACDCKAGFEPGIVLDPFAGTGTVGVVAKSMGRRFILIDIKKEYMDMAERRVAQVGHQKELFE